MASANARYLESRDSWNYEKKQADAELSEAKAQCSSAELEFKTARATNGAAVSKLDLKALVERDWAAYEFANNNRRLLGIPPGIHFR